VRKQGAIAEQHACAYLIQQGLQLQQRNYHCRFGEIDLIMQDKAQLVFVEVRFRKNDDYGDAAASITYQKQQKLIKTAHHYLMSTRRMNTMACRFDALLMTSNVCVPDIEWVKDAFQL